MKTKKIYGIIISAGLSGRMGKFKPLLSYRGKSFIQNIVLKLGEVCDKVIIVTGFKPEEIGANIRQLNAACNIEFAFNRDYKKGMFTSLQAGLRKTGSCDWIFYHFVDQPGLPGKFYTDFTGQIDEEHNWIQPKIKEQKGHPLLIKSDLCQIILNAPLNSNLRAISNDPKVNKKFWECGYAEIFQDIDTEEDYSKLN
ncbi:molybdenum cofactor cytidylyltransferase [bacterium BMS3Abin03]|nr:molybdenum cofactor cytidylyltransferase [bacterium BMS3Abin03]